MSNEYKLNFAIPSNYELPPIGSVLITVNDMDRNKVTPIFRWEDTSLPIFPWHLKFVPEKLSDRWGMSQVPIEVNVVITDMEGNLVVDHNQHLWMSSHGVKVFLNVPGFQYVTFWGGNRVYMDEATAVVVIHEAGNKVAIVGEIAVPELDGVYVPYDSDRVVVGKTYTASAIVYNWSSNVIRDLTVFTEDRILKSL